MTGNNPKKRYGITDSPLTSRTITAHGVTYTIYGNNDLALKLGEERINGNNTTPGYAKDNTPKSNTQKAATRENQKPQVTEKRSEQKYKPTKPDYNSGNAKNNDTNKTAPKAIPVPDNEDLPAWDRPENQHISELLLPSLDEPETNPAGLLPLPESDLKIPYRGVESHQQPEIQAQSRAEYVKQYLATNNGRFTSYSQTLIPANPTEAKAVLDDIVETYTAINEFHGFKGSLNDLRNFVEEHYTFVAIKNRNATTVNMSIDNLMDRAKLTDLEKAQVEEKVGVDRYPIKGNIVDSNPYDRELTRPKQLEGTFDTDGWVEAKKLIDSGAKALYKTDNPTMEQLEEYTRKNASFEKYQKMTYRGIIVKAHEEELREEKLNAQATNQTPKPEKQFVGELPQPPKQKQYIWFTVEDQNGFNTAYEMIQSEYNAKIKWAKDDGKEFSIPVERFADDNFMIREKKPIPDKKEQELIRIPYQTLKTKVGK